MNISVAQSSSLGGFAHSEAPDRECRYPAHFRARNRRASYSAQQIRVSCMKWRSRPPQADFEGVAHRAVDPPGATAVLVVELDLGVRVDGDGVVRLREIDAD